VALTELEELEYLELLELAAASEQAQQPQAAPNPEIAVAGQQLADGGMFEKIIEPAATMLSGGLSMAGGGLAGLVSAPFVGLDEAANISKEVSNRIPTYSPQTQSGQEGLENFSAAFDIASDVVRAPASALGAVTELVAGQGEDQARDTMRSIQEDGIRETMGERGFELGGPALGTFMKMLPDLYLAFSSIAKSGKQVSDKVSTIAAATPDGAQRSVLAIADDLGVPVLTTDIFPPQTYMGRLAASISDKLGPLGTGGKRTVQQRGRVEAVTGMADEMGIDLNTPFAESIVKSVTAKSAKVMEKAGIQRSQAITAIDRYGDFDAPRSIKAADDVIAKELMLGEKANMAIIDDATKFKSEITKPSDFSLKAAHRTKLIKDRAKYGRSEDVDPAVAAQTLKSALDKDMIAFARTKDKAATKAWLDSNRKFAAEADISKRTTMRQILESGDVKPESVLTMLKGGKLSELERLHSGLGVKGRTNAKKALIQQALKDSGFFKTDVAPNPDAFVTALNRPNFQQAARVFFKGSDKAELDGVARFLDATRKAQESQHLVRTGEIAGVAGGILATSFSAAASPWITAGVVGTAMALIKSYESPVVRNMLIKLRNAAPGSQQELTLIEKINAALVAETARETE
jgi:hypothetical protein